jgi:hypothetical protein
MSATGLHKAPNILILSESDEEFSSLKDFIKKLLGINSYTIYNMKMAQLKNLPSLWMDNCCLLISVESTADAQDTAVNEKINYIKTFLNLGGNVLSIPSANGIDKPLLKEFTDKKLTISSIKFPCDSEYSLNGFEKNILNSTEKDLNDLIYSYKVNGEHWFSKVVPSFQSSSETYVEDVFMKLFIDKLNLKKSEKINSELQPYYVFSQNKVNFLIN